MTRRLLAAVTLAFFGSGLFAFAAPAHAEPLCIGGENQRKPDQYMGICIGDFVDNDLANQVMDICKLGHH